jgi:hypothetical protein
MPSEGRDTSRWLQDIRHQIALAEGFTAGVAYESFKDTLTYDLAPLRAVIEAELAALPPP